MWHCDFYSPPPNHSLISSEYIVCANPSISQSLINILGFIQSLCGVRVCVCVSVCSLVLFKGTLPSLPCHLSDASSAAVTRPAHTTQLQVLMGVNKGADFVARLSKTHKLFNWVFQRDQSRQNFGYTSSSHPEPDACCLLARLIFKVGTIKHGGPFISMGLFTQRIRQKKFVGLRVEHVAQ